MHGYAIYSTGLFVLMEKSWVLALIDQHKFQELFKVNTHCQIAK